MKIDAIGLFVDDMETMVSFYREVMKTAADWDGGPYAEFQTEGARLMMFGRRDFEAMTSQAYDYPKGLNGTMEIAFDFPCFSDVDQEYGRLIEAGARAVFGPATMAWGQRTAYIADPEGNLIEIGSFGKRE